MNKKLKLTVFLASWLTQVAAVAFTFWTSDINLDFTDIIILGIIFTISSLLVTKITLREKHSNT